MSMSQWLLPNGPSPTLYARLQFNLENAIRSGELPPGAKLPPERELAEQLQVSRTTVTNAYRELESKGLVRGFVGRGTFVCAVPEPSHVPFAWQGKMSATSLRLGPQCSALNGHSLDPKLISFALGTPALECFPVEEYRRIEQQILARRSFDALGLGALNGQPALREAIAHEFSAGPDQVLVVAGSQSGLDLLARSLVNPADHVIVERPGYFTAFQTFWAAGARLVGWDAVRSDLGELEDLILRYRPKFLCTTPSFHNPTGRTLSLSQRRELIDLAVRYRLPVIEDDPYRELYFDAPAPPTLHALDKQGVVIHLGTFSKVLAPGLRLGYIIAPEKAVNLLAQVKHRTSSFTAGPQQLALAEMLRSGILADHLVKLRQEHRVRLETMVGACARMFPRGILTFRMPAGGGYLWARLSHGLKAADLNRLAIEEGVVFAPGELFYPDEAGSQELRLCFSGTTAAGICDGMGRLKRALDRAIPGA